MIRNLSIEGDFSKLIDRCAQPSRKVIFFFFFFYSGTEIKEERKERNKRNKEKKERKRYRKNVREHVTE